MLAADRDRIAGSKGGRASRLGLVVGSKVGRRQLYRVDGITKSWDGVMSVREGVVGSSGGRWQFHEWTSRRSRQLSDFTRMLLAEKKEIAHQKINVASDFVNSMPHTIFVNLKLKKNHRRRRVNHCLMQKP